ncbi:TIR domain-containing protein [Actinokineospora iranica]|uniref:TIR domain-containing protein n=1 Tax=Actinokineospora iranica TaxID=1271860 RepID=A0A1G6S066_9PSEU|nr:TIR domain-containing protein [Actinokineospora iranica]SDD10312.1 TIR domain-containing protein [Actinokineospora iranica]
MALVFINYRERDQAHLTQTLYAHLARRLGDEQVFVDSRSLPIGRRYPPEILSALARADMVLAVTGRDWETARDETGGRRLDNPGDWVRREIADSLARGVPVVPGIDLDREPPATSARCDDVVITVPTQIDAAAESTLALWVGLGRPTGLDCARQVTGALAGLPVFTFTRGTVVCVRTTEGRVALIEFVETDAGAGRWSRPSSGRSDCFGCVTGITAPVAWRCRMIYTADRGRGWRGHRSC